MVRLVALLSLSFFLCCGCSAGTSSFESVFSEVKMRFVKTLEPRLVALHNDMAEKLRREPTGTIPAPFLIERPQCTGFFVSRSHILTANHCRGNLGYMRRFFQSENDGWEKFLSLDEFEWFSFKGKLAVEALASENRIPLGQDKIVFTDEANDFLVLEVPPEAESRDYFHLDIKGSLSKIGVAKLLSYPAGLPLVESDKELFFRDGNIIRHDIDSFPGSSGGPLIGIDSNVVALHTQGSHLMMNSLDIIHKVKQPNSRELSEHYCSNMGHEQGTKAFTDCVAIDEHNKAIPIDVIAASICRDKFELCKMIFAE